MTSVLLELRVINRAPESVSHVAVGHWPSSSNYLGSVKIVSAARGPPTCRREEELLSYRSAPEIDWTRKWSHRERRDCCCVNVCVSSDFDILSLSSTRCRIFEREKKTIDHLKVDPSRTHLFILPWSELRKPWRTSENFFWWSIFQVLTNLLYSTHFFS